MFTDNFKKNTHKLLSIFNKNNQLIKESDRYKQIFTHVCNGVYNYNTLIANRDVKSEEYSHNIRIFFGYIRWVHLDQDICSVEKYDLILEFIKTDFYNYCSGISNCLDIEKFKNICEVE